MHLAVLVQPLDDESRPQVPVSPSPVSLRWNRVVVTGADAVSYTHLLPLLPYCFVASQVYRTNNAFLTYVETVISSLNFRETGLEEFVEMVTFYVINRLRHYREEQVIDLSLIHI